MDQSQIYVTLSVIVLAIIAAVIVYIGKKSRESGLSRFAALSFVFILAGIIFSKSRLVGYSFIGIGLLFALIDIVKKFKNRHLA